MNGQLETAKLEIWLPEADKVYFEGLAVFDDRVVAKGLTAPKIQGLAIWWVVWFAFHGKIPIFLDLNNMAIPSFKELNRSGAQILVPDNS